MLVKLKSNVGQAGVKHFMHVLLQFELIFNFWCFFAKSRVSFWSACWRLCESALGGVFPEGLIVSHQGGTISEISLVLMLFLKKASFIWSYFLHCRSNLHCKFSSIFAFFRSIIILNGLELVRAPLCDTMSPSGNTPARIWAKLSHSVCFIAIENGLKKKKIKGAR